MGLLSHCLVDQMSRCRSSAAGGTGLIPGGITKIPHAMLQGRKEKEKASQAERKNIDNTYS